MKKSTPFLTAFLVFLPLIFFGQTDPACMQAGCATDIINLSTGFDHSAQQPYPSGSFDAFWTLTASPDATISVPRPAYVLAPDQAWDLVTGTAYISAYPNAGLNANNPAPGTPYRFESCFCVCGDSSQVTVSLSAHADNNAEIYLVDAAGTTVQTLLSITSTSTSAFTDPPETASHTLVLTAGEYCIRADVRNLSGVAMGLDIGCTITGASLLQTLCCNPNGGITGQKYADLDCDGALDANEPGLPGWTIVLCDQVGLPVTSVVTDAQGYYSFLDVLPGNYLVKENQQPGWTVAQPINGQYAVAVGQAQIIADLHFGNCETEEACEVAACQTNQVVINTGYDPVAGTVGATGSYDGYWTVCETPDPAISVPRPAFLVSPNPAWANQINTAWISPFPVSNLNQNNPAPDPPYGIKYCFCVCDSTDVTINLSALADNNVSIYLIEKTTGTPLTPLLNITATNTSAFTTPTTSSIPIVLGEGQYCIQADLRNLSGVAMGLNVMGTLSGANLLESICCDNTGSITGGKYNDLNCDGDRDPNEPGLPGWEIVLCDQAGSPLDTALTDAAGFYTFAGLAPGVYEVKENQQEGWTQSQPAGGGTYTIGLSPKEVAADVDFGNCDFCPGNLVQNGSFGSGTPPGGDESIQFATNWGAIWGNGSSTADFYNTTTAPPPFAGPFPASQGNFAASWIRLQGDQDVWREGAMNALSSTILPNTGCYDLSLKLACLFEPAGGAAGLCFYGVNAPGGLASGSITDGDTPDNLNIFPAGNTVELASYAIPGSCDANFTTLNFQFDSGILPAAGITHIFITRCDGMSGAEFVALDDVCLKPGTCPSGGCEANFEWSILDSCGHVQFLNASQGGNLSYCWDFDGDAICDSNLPSPAHQFPASGSYTVCLTVTDSDGCTDTQCHTISVIHLQGPPVIICPGDFTVDCDFAVLTFPVVDSGPCGDTLIVDCTRSDGLPFGAPVPPCTTLTVSCFAANEYGSSTCQYNVTTVDNQPPAAVCVQGLNVLLGANCTASITPGDVDGGSFDNCSQVTLSLSQSVFTANDACQTVGVTLTVMDACGNSSQCVTAVQVLDNTPPVITCPAGLQVACDTNLDPSVTGFPTAFDNCGGNLAFIFSDTVNGVFPCDAVVTRSWFVSDACGNVATCDQTIFVADQTAPQITCPPDLTLIDPDPTDPANTGFATATDNCDLSPTITHSDVATGSDPCPKTITRTWGAMDDCFNLATCTQVINVECGAAFDCPGNLVQNGSFGSGTPPGGDESIQFATNWGAIWGNGSSTADFYNTTTAPPPFAGPFPASQGNFAASWIRLQGDQDVWREGAMNALSSTILPSTGCYDLSLKLACLFEPAGGAAGLCFYGVNAPGGLASGSITDGDTPDNLNIFPAGNTVELASYAIPGSCDANFTTLNFQFDSGILPAAGITHIFITRCDGMSGAEFVALDDVCLTPGTCPSGGCDSLAQECLTDVLDVSTGIDHVNGGAYTSARYDAFWTLVETDASVSVPRPATVISPFLLANWGFQGGAEWLSFYEDYEHFDNNPAPQPPHAFERCFCLCSDEADVTFDLKAMADDIVDINLFDSSNGLVANLLTLDNTTAPNFNNPPNPALVTVPLTAGSYCIRADLRNTDQVATGFNMKGTLTGGVFQKAECCRQGNIIYGVVYHDEDQEGFRDFRLNNDPPEPGLNGWTVQLCDLGSTPLFTTTSDQFGFYKFENVPAGSYLLKDILMPSWVQTEPATVEYNVTIGAQDVVANLNFGNYLMDAVREAQPISYLGDIAISPNPARAGATLIFGQPTPEELRLQLFDATGRLAAEWQIGKGSQRLEMDVQQLPSALYFARLADGEGRAWHGKFVKQ